MKSVSAMAVHERGVLKLPRSMFCFKGLIKLLLYAGAVLAIIQIVSYRTDDTRNVLNYNGSYFHWYPLSNALKSNGYLSTKNVGFFPDIFVGKEVQRQKCREFCRKNVRFCLEARIFFFSRNCSDRESNSGPTTLFLDSISIFFYDR